MEMTLTVEVRKKIDYLRQLSDENDQISDDETDAVVSVLEEFPGHLEQHVNILDAIVKLQRLGIVSKQTRFELIEKYKQSKTAPHDQFFELLSDIVVRCPLQKIVHFLRWIHCDRLAHDIGKEISIHVMNRADIADSRSLEEFFRTIKLNFDNNILISPTDVLRDIANRRRSLAQEPQHVAIIQRNAEEYVTAKWVEINTMRDGTFDERLVVLEEMEKNVPHDIPSASMYARLLYLTKRAVSHALKGDWRMAEHDIQDAKSNMINCEDHFVKILMYHDFQFIFRLKYSATRVHEDLNMVILMGDRGMKLAEHLQIDHCVSWERLFKLNMAIAILGVGPKLDVVANDISLECIMIAKSLVEQVGDRKYYVGISSREEISYYICRARLYEADANWESAKDYAIAAMNLAEDGTPFDTDRQHIRDYVDGLLARDTTKTQLLPSLRSRLQRHASIS